MPALAMFPVLEVSCTAENLAKSQIFGSSDHTLHIWLRLGLGPDILRVRTLRYGQVPGISTVAVIHL